MGIIQSVVYRLYSLEVKWCIISNYSSSLSLLNRFYTRLIICFLDPVEKRNKSNLLIWGAESWAAPVMTLTRKSTLLLTVSCTSSWHPTLLEICIVQISTNCAVVIQYFGQSSFMTWGKLFYLRRCLLNILFRWRGSPRRHAPRRRAVELMQFLCRIDACPSAWSSFIRPDKGLNHASTAAGWPIKE